MTAPQMRIFPAPRHLSLGVLVGIIAWIAAKLFVVEGRRSGRRSVRR
jgi:hypothetical protein